jgi:5'-nucleotidase
MAIALPGCMQDDQTLTILHTNDVHSHIDPFPPNHPHFPNLGGFARRMKLINQLRAENQNLLLLDAGDTFQGTPYFNIFGGELEFKLMSRMKYDAVTLGNHEFDNGMIHLANQLKHADFPFVCTNYQFESTPLQSKTIPWLILERGPFKIGIIGMGIDPSGLITPANTDGMQWTDPLKKGEETALMLKKEQKCNLVIALSHLGFESQIPEGASDMRVAANSSNIDLIIGGHSHTFLDTPRLVKNRQNRGVLINQMGWGGVRLGRIDLTMGRKGLFFCNKTYLIK